MTGDENDRKNRVLLIELLLQLQTRHAGHVEIGDDAPRLERFGGIEENLSTGEGATADFQRLQQESHRRQNLSVIVDDVDDRGDEPDPPGMSGVCLATSGPGGIHLLNGLYDARKSHAPVLAICGQVPREEMGTEFFQEVDNDRLFADVAAVNSFGTSLSDGDGEPEQQQVALREPGQWALVDAATRNRSKPSTRGMKTGVDPNPNSKAAKKARRKKR